jgi:hypothetical protein
MGVPCEKRGLPLMRRSWLLLTLMTSGLGSALVHTECGELLDELSRLRKKSAEDDARIVRLEARLARAENCIERGAGEVKRLPSDSQLPPPLPWLLSAKAAKDSQLSARGGTRRRSILQANVGIDSLACAKDDLHRLQTARLNHGDGAGMAVFNEILSANPVCGVCLISCVPALDIVYCFFSCMHQRENQCSDHQQLAPLVSRARLSDRASIVAILGAVDPDCAYACSLFGIAVHS